MVDRREYNKEWAEKNKEHRREYKKQYREINKEKLKNSHKEYYIKNRENILQKQKNSKILNREKYLKKSKRYRINNWSGYFISRIKKRSKDRFSEDVDFDSDYLKDLFSRQKGKCYWTNLKMVLEVSNKNPFQVSIDRLDNNKGYTKDNIVLCCMMINYARNNCDYDTWNDIMKNQISIKYRKKKS